MLGSARADARTQPTATTPSERPSKAGTRVVLAVFSLATLAWVISAVAFSDRGFAGANEGYYLMSYRDWSTTSEAATMSPYLYGPIFHLLDESVVGLRVVRVAMILVVHACFGWQFMRWLRLRRPTAPATWTWEAAGIAAITASAGILYGWLPKTPGYNDVSILGSLLLVSVVLGAARAADRGERAGIPGSLLFGVVGSTMVLAKVSMMLAAVALGLVHLWFVSQGNRRRLLAHLPAMALGIVAPVGVIAVLRPLDEVFPPFIEALKIRAAHSHQPLELLLFDVKTLAVALLLGALVFALPTALVGYGVDDRLGRGRVWPVFLISVAVALLMAWFTGGLQAGLDHVDSYSAAVVGMLVLVLGVAIVAKGTDGRSETLVLVTLLAAPLLAGLGTSNPLLAISIGGASLWVALMITASTRLQSTGWALTAAATTVAVLVASIVGVIGTLHDPSGRALYTSSLRGVPGLPLADDLRFPAAQARSIARLRQQLMPLLAPGQPMIAYGELAQWVLFLGGDPVGEAWFSANEDGIQTANLTDACKQGAPWGMRHLVVLVSRDLTSEEVAGLAKCGIDYERDYDMAAKGPSFRVMLPQTVEKLATPSGKR